MKYLHTYLTDGRKAMDDGTHPTLVKLAILHDNPYYLARQASPELALEMYAIGMAVNESDASVTIWEQFQNIEHELVKSYGSTSKRRDVVGAFRELASCAIEMNATHFNAYRGWMDIFEHTANHGEHGLKARQAIFEAAELALGSTPPSWTAASLINVSLSCVDYDFSANIVTDELALRLAPKVNEARKHTPKEHREFGDGGYFVSICDSILEKLFVNCSSAALTTLKKNHVTDGIFGLPGGRKRIVNLRKELARIKKERAQGQSPKM